MKKLIAILIMSFMLSTMLVACVPGASPDEGKENDGVLGGDPTDGEENGDNKGDNPTEGGENTDNKGDNPTDGGENTDNKGDNPTEGGENTDNNGDNPTEGGENTDNKGDNPTEGGESGDNSGSNGENTGETPTPEVGTQVGDLLASVSLERLDGGTVSPDDFRGKVVVLNIWATWCPPCKAELPDFNKFAADYAEDVVIIAAHDYYGKQDAPSYVAENFPDTDIIFAYDSVAGDAYNAAGGDGYVPFTAVLDRNGVIIYSDSGILSYERLVELVNQADE